MTIDKFLPFGFLTPILPSGFLTPSYLSSLLCNFGVHSGPILKKWGSVISGALLYCFIMLFCFTILVVFGFFFPGELRIANDSGVFRRRIERKGVRLFSHIIGNEFLIPTQFSSNPLFFFFFHSMCIFIDFIIYINLYILYEL